MHITTSNTILKFHAIRTDETYRGEEDFGAKTLLVELREILVGVICAYFKEKSCFLALVV